MNLFFTTIKSISKNNIYMFITVSIIFRYLPHFLKKLILPHEEDFIILKMINVSKKIKVLDIGGGCGESIISFYKMRDNIEIDTYEPNYRNYLYCKKLKKYYKNLTVFNCAYGNSTKSILYVPKIRNFFLDNFSGFNVKDIKYNIKNLFNKDIIEFHNQEVCFDISEKSYDIIKIDCETGFYELVQNLTHNIDLSTILIIENSKQSKQVFNFLKEINNKYECFYLLNSKLIKYDLDINDFDKNILNLIFIPNSLKLNSP